MRIAYFSPLPPLRTGIADYSLELLPHLAQYAEIDLFVDDGYEPAPNICERFPVHSYHEYAGRSIDREYDVCVYQMGNDAGSHSRIYQTLLMHPGVVVLHEYVLQDFMRGMTFPRGDFERYIEEMRYCYGNRGVSRARAALMRSLPVDSRAYPLFERVVDASLGLIVHNEAARQRILQTRPLAPVGKVSFPVVPPDPMPSQDEIRQVRVGLSLQEEDVLIGSFGFATSHKRLEISMQAFARFRREYPRAKYLVVGQVTQGVEIDSLVQKYALQGSVVLTGYVAMDTFLRYMAAVDVALNLRFPPGGETSASAMRLMSLGKPVIVSNAGSFAEYPDDCCVKVDVDDSEVDMLVAVMKALAADGELRRTIGSNARHYIEEHHRPSGCAKEYVDFIQALLSSQPIPIAVRPPLAKAARDDVLASIISELAIDLVDLNLKEDDDTVLGDISEAIVDMGLEPHRSGRGSRDTSDVDGC
jgi:glycosyltransferase involved in cell wall biosynthesis